MADWIELVERARKRDLEAFDVLVGRFRDMAVGYAFSLLGDFQQAEDAAQEAFIRAYLDMDMLREPRAFPAWLRRIVFKQCDRVTRGRRPRRVPLESVREGDGWGGDSLADKRRRHNRDDVLEGVRSLPETERAATTLYYIDGYSVAEVGDFLEVPTGTVKSRLHSARLKLRERMVDMVKDSLRKSAPGEEFNRRIKTVLEGVPRVSFELHSLEVEDGLPRCPESMPFASCLRACMEYLGEGWGGDVTEGHGARWRLDRAYIHLMGTTGTAFKLSWKPGWYPGNPSLSLMPEGASSAVRHGFDSIGFGFEILKQDPAGENRDLFRRRIIQSIRGRGRPVIALGVVGPPVECLITGFDDEGETLIGWSFFQGAPEFSGGLEFEPSGSFRKRNWYPETRRLYLLGEKRDPSDKVEIHRKALERGVELIRTPLGREGSHNGLSAFDAWAEALVRDSDFVDLEAEALFERYLVHEDAVGCVAEGRWYAGHFLRRAMALVPAWEKPLSEAAAGFEAEHQLMWKLWGLVGGPGRAADAAPRLRDSALRARMAGLVREAREKEAAAAVFIERALTG